MPAPGNYPSLQSSGLAVIPEAHQTLLSAGLREKERGSGSSGSGPYPNWPYRGTIQITNPVNIANYQHLLILSWLPGMKFDFSDIRFAQQNGTICPYWIETYTSKISARVWIKVPSAKQGQIYLYYGNPSATSGSDGDATFLFFDDFNDNSLNSTKWTIVSGGGSATVLEQGSQLQIRGDGSNRAYARTVSSFSAPYILEFSAKKGENIETIVHWDGAFQGAYDLINTGYYAPIFVSWVSPTVFQLSKAWEDTKQSYSSSLDSNWHSYSVRLSSSGFTISLDGTQILSTSDTYRTSGYIGFSARETPNAINAYYDNVRVRKYGSPEPTLTLRQYGPRPDTTIIYYPFLPSPLGILPSGDFFDELIEFTQTITGETPIVSLNPTITFIQTMVGSTPNTDYFEAPITPTQTMKAKIFAKIFLNLSLVRTKSITISKSIQDTLWRADISLHQYKNLDMTVLRHCTYATTDHNGVSRTLFTGILPGNQPQLAPADETSRITGYDYAWFLTQRKVPEAYLHNTAATNPATVITGLLGGNDWMSETGIEPYSIQTVDEWGDTLNTRVFDFDRTTSRIQAIQRICDYCRYVFIVKWRDIGGGILNPCAYFCHEDDIDTYLDLPAEVTFTKPDPYVDDKITWDVKGDERYNRVTVYGRESNGASISFTAETPDVTNGDEIPVEFVESSGAFTTAAQVQARAEELLDYFSTEAKTYTVVLKNRVDLELLQKVRFIGWTEIPETSMRIISISYTIDDATAMKKVTIQATSETKLLQIKRMYRCSNPDPLSEAEALFDAKAAAMPGNDVGVVTAIDETSGTATVLLEDGRTVTARII